MIANWTVDGAVLARMSMIVLPRTAKLSSREITGGHLRVDGQGLQPGWHIAVIGEDSDIRVIVPADGRVQLDLISKDLPGTVTLRLSDPETGNAP